MVEKLIQHPGLLSALCMVNDRAGLVASSMAADPEPVLDLPGDKLQDGSIDKWPQEQVRLHAVQAWETELDAALFKVSNAAVRFAETVLGVKEVQDNLAEEDKALSKQLHENMPVEQEG